jgi:Zn finger protein HypA/HybF involved in hydrogenase expression
MDGGIVAPRYPAGSAGERPATDRKGIPMATPQAYCVKCKTKREMQDATQIQMKNGRPATEGKCPVCGTKMFKIGAA